MITFLAAFAGTLLAFAVLAFVAHFRRKPPMTQAEIVALATLRDLAMCEVHDRSFDALFRAMPPSDVRIVTIYDARAERAKAMQAYADAFADR